MKSEKIVETIIEALEEIKGVDIQCFDLRNREAITDFVIICSGTSNVHINALKDNLRKTLTTQKIKLTSESGFKDSNWYILDYGEFIIHILGAAERDYYKLEDLWQGAQVVYHM